LAAQGLEALFAMRIDPFRIFLAGKPWTPMIRPPPQDASAAQIFTMRTNHRWRVFILAWIIVSTFQARATITILDYWHLGDNDPGAVSGGAVTNLIDSAGAQNLTAQGTATYTNDVSTTAAARTGSSLSVAFTNGALASSPIVSSVVDNFGIECWVKPAADVNAGQVIVYNGSTATSGWGFLLSGSQFLGLYGGVDIFGTGAAVPNVWTHVALVRDSGNSTLYVNGVPAGTSLATPHTPGGNFAIAAPPQVPIGSGQSLTGRVDEVRMFVFAPGQFNTNDLLYFQTTYTFGTTNYVEGPGAGTDTVVLGIGSPASSWAATVNVPWLHLSAASGATSTNIIFSFDSNPGATRTGTIAVGAQTLTITQAGASYVAAGALTTLVDSGVGLYFPHDSGVDAAGNFYVSDGSDTGAVHKWTKADNTTTTIITTGLKFPFGIAVDSPGNVFLIDGGENLVQKWTAANSNITLLVSSGLNGPTHGAVDAAGNLYFSDTDYNSIKKWTATNGNVTTVVSNTLIQPYGLTVDAAGNVYLCDAGDKTIKKWTAANNITTTLLNNITNIGCVAVDNGGNVYYTDSSDHTIKRRQASNGNITTAVSSGLTLPGYVCVDDARNLYVVESIFNGVVHEQPRAFVNAATRVENSAAGTDSLPAVLPVTANLLPPFAPTSSDPSWLTITGITNGVVTFSFTANSGATRTANITVLGQAVPITQQTTLTPPIITGFKLLTNTVIQFSFSNNQSTLFTVISSTNLSTPLSNWTVLGAPSNIAAGSFQFTSQPVTNDSRRFYRVRSP
jgi:sugar lactone lactonase YvrE